MRASPCGVEATAAKYLAAEASDELSLRAVRAHGGFGFAWSTSFDPHPVVHDRAFCRNVRGAPRRLPLAHDIEGARRNAISPGVLSGFCEAIERVQHDRDIRAVVLTGARDSVPTPRTDIRSRSTLIRPGPKSRFR
jgi:hypothetical protein